MYRVHMLNPSCFAFWIVMMNPFFVNCDNSMQKAFSFLSLQNLNLQIIFFRRCMSLSVNSCGSQFPNFWIILIPFKRYEIHSWVTFNRSQFSLWLVWVFIQSYFQFFIFKLFCWSSMIFVLGIIITISKSAKPILTCRNRRSMLKINFYKQVVCFHRNIIM